MSTIYVIEQSNGDVFMVEAGSQAQAIRHTVRSLFKARPAKPQDVAKLIGDGVKVEKAGE